MLGSSCQRSLATPVALHGKGEFYAYRVKDASWARWLVVVGTPLPMPLDVLLSLGRRGESKVQGEERALFLAIYY